MHISMSLGTLVMNYGVLEVAERLDLKWAFLGISAVIAVCAVCTFFMLTDTKKDSKSHLCSSGKDESHHLYQEECENKESSPHGLEESRSLLIRETSKSLYAGKTKTEMFKSAMKLMWREL